MTQDMDPNLSPETVKELMGDDVREYRRRDKKTNVVDIVKVSYNNHFPVERHIELLNRNDPDHEYSAIPDGEDGDNRNPENEDNTITIRIPNV